MCFITGYRCVWSILDSEILNKVHSTLVLSHFYFVEYYKILRSS
ncbi:hypothetical protein CRENPOLYSF1_100089 [Crenothrix polyspora]|uniref:Uncharacterized protein n=1 Tax=Crenothrix polyspora TaxID=360316 RepID=A0A1R4GZ12_9GAMM|nr:hypothetical protein CRENPOLYSF1_100089 [Crenothrix polyspora]